MRDEDKRDRPPRDRSKDKRKGIDYSSRPLKRFKNDEEDYDSIFTIPQEIIFVELKDQNIFRQPRPSSLLEHMKDISQFCIFHNDYEHTLATCRNLYRQLKGMMKKGQLLKHLKKKIPVGLRKGPWNSEGLATKVVTKKLQRK